MRTLAVAALLTLAVPLAAVARAKTEEIVTPVTINLETRASAAQIKKGVKMAVLNRKWTISDEKGNSFVATYTKPGRKGDDLTAKIRVTHGKTVKIEYVDSTGMDYDAAGKTINRTYNSWVKNLEKDIPIYVEREIVASE